MVETVLQIDSLIDGTDLAYTETVIPNTTNVWKNPTKKIYQSPPHITVDNHFSGDNIMKFMGSKGMDSLSLAAEIASQWELNSISIEKK